MTKTDLCEDAQDYVAKVTAIAAGIDVLCVDARSGASAARMSYLLQPGSTVAFVGSSGVGKSTLINSLLGEPIQETARVREQDQRGRHTTTSRQMFLLASGTWVIDTPGMRELGVLAEDATLDDVFADIGALSLECAFNDCTHTSEPGCAVRGAIQSGGLNERRLENYLKLQRESTRQRETQRERRARERKQGRHYHATMRNKRGR